MWLLVFAVFSLFCFILFCCLFLFFFRRWPGECKKHRGQKRKETKKTKNTYTPYHTITLNTTFHSITFRYITVHNLHIHVYTYLYIIYHLRFKPPISVGPWQNKSPLSSWRSLYQRQAETFRAPRSSHLVDPGPTPLGCDDVCMYVRMYVCKYVYM